jgi:SAM-dependent methyltransferase
MQTLIPHSGWSEFFKATKDNPPWPLMERAAELLGRPGQALDLGAGAGRDTRYLLARGWRVTAVDRESEAIALLAKLPQANLQAIESSFEDFTFGLEEYDLVSAQFSLPFVPRASFFTVFSRIKQALKPGGIFTGQFFGIHDEWNMTGSDMTFLTREEVDEVLGGMNVIEITEEDKMGGTATGGEKHWHVFHVIAQKE